MSTPLRIVFLGSDPIALPGLEWLEKDGCEWGRVIAVFTQPDRAAGRGQKLTPNEIKRWALARDLPVYQPAKVTGEVRMQLEALRPDVSLVMAYGHILKEDFIGTPRLGTLNLHASLLPRYRGASPIQTAIANRERETGITLMRIVRALDAGPAAAYGPVPILTSDTALEIEAKLGDACVPLLKSTLPKLIAGNLEFLEQDHPSATYCRRLVKDDGALDFSSSALELAARIRGLFPWPGCGVEVGGQPIKLGLADVPAPDAADGAGVASTTVPGTVLGIDAAGLRVATGAGVLRILKLQRPGGKMLAAAEFLRGFPLERGAVLPSRPMLALVSQQPFPQRPSP